MVVKWKGKIGDFSLPFHNHRRKGIYLFNEMFGATHNPISNLPKKEKTDTQRQQDEVVGSASSVVPPVLDQDKPSP